MKYYFANKRIEGVLSVLPENVYYFEDEVVDPNNPKARRLKNLIGFGTRRRAKENTTMSDLFLYGLKNLIDEKKINKDEIGAIVVVTLCPDYYLPQIINIIHGELELSNDVQCIDIPQACTGYICGLIESFMLLEHMPDNKKVVLCTGEILNRKAGEEPKTEEPSFGGDVANISIIANCEKGYNDRIVADLRFDGKQRNALLIKYGGFRYPMTREILDNKVGNLPCTGVDMDGSGVFNFVQKEVPPMIKEMTEELGYSLEDYAYFLFHQPNKFMLQKLATAIGVPFDKMPMKLTEEYGNSDSGTIPMIMSTYVAEELKNKDNLCCVSGFGGGLTWGAMIIHVGNLEFCENIISDL